VSGIDERALSLPEISRLRRMRGAAVSINPRRFIV